ncbi:tetratricopeptide repeat protein [bacterium]|nr:tetratricopeptide repeat protein [bacterium]MCI0611932.1 tetratricopeptide repeat protein [bacterium]
MWKGQALPTQNIAVLCRECHGRIQPEDQFCNHCDAVILRRYCAGCRKLVPDHALMCPYCGASAGEKPKVGILQYPMNVATMILLLFVASLYFLWPSEKKTNQVKSPAQQNIKAPEVAQIPAVKKEVKPAVTVSAKKAAVVKVGKNVQPKNVQEGARLNLEGHALIKQGKYQEAVSTLHQAVETFPENTENIEYVFAQYNLAHSLRKVGKSEEAIPYLKRCIAYDSHNVMFQKELQAAQRDLSRN